VEVGDGWATVRDRTGRLIEQFVFSTTTTPETIDSRLALLKLQAAS